MSLSREYHQSTFPFVGFYNQVLGTLQGKVKEKGYLKKEIIIVPEVFEKGKKTVLDILRDDDLKMHCKTPDDYYYAILILSFSHGILFTDLWQKDYEQFEKSFDSYSYDDSSELFAERFLVNYYGLEKSQRNNLFVIIFMKWRELVLPYMNDKNARDYIFSSFLAIYNLGVCFAMEKYGEYNSVTDIWRDENGNIACNEESCKKMFPDKCDSSCPVHLHSLAMSLAKSGNLDAAIETYKKALNIAPDYYDAWNNIAGYYGRKGDYKKAYECFSKAHDLNKKRPAPLLGLVLASKDLGKYEECIKWCDEHDKLAQSETVDKVRKIAESKI